MIFDVMTGLASGDVGDDETSSLVSAPFESSGVRQVKRVSMESARDVIVRVIRGALVSFE